jgi:hypothetical protein
MGGKKTVATFAQTKHIYGRSCTRAQPSVSSDTSVVEQPTVDEISDRVYILKYDGPVSFTLISIQWHLLYKGLKQNFFHFGINGR